MFKITYMKFYKEEFHSDKFKFAKDKLISSSFQLSENAYIHVPEISPDVGSGYEFVHFLIG